MKVQRVERGLFKRHDNCNLTFSDNRVSLYAEDDVRCENPIVSGYLTGKSFHMWSDNMISMTVFVAVDDEPDLYRREQWAVIV